MRVERLELLAYGLPFERPYVTARGRLDRREIVLVRLTTDTEHEGLGEAVPLSLRGGADTAEILADLERVRGVLEGAEFGVDTLTQLLAHCGRTLDHAPSLAAIDMGLLDLAGKQQSAPAWQLLGAGEARPVVCNATLVSGTPADVAEDARRWADAGFSCFKLKVGAGQDVAELAAVRKALGPGAKLRIDTNGTWGTEEAIHKLHEMAELELELAEQPVETLEELAEVHSSTSVTIVADESVAEPEEAEVAARLEACDAATIKLSKVGGTLEARDIAAVLPSYMSSALDGPVGIAAAAHLVQLLPDHGWAHGLATQRLFSEWPATAAPTLGGDLLTLTDAPGLGVELDLEAITRLRLPVS